MYNLQVIYAESDDLSQIKSLQRKSATKYATKIIDQKSMFLKKIYQKEHTQYY